MSRAALDIEGWAKKSIAGILRPWLAGCIIFRLHRRRAELVRREGWKDKSGRQICRRRSRVKRAPDAARLLLRLGIPPCWRGDGARPVRFETLPALRGCGAGAAGDESAAVPLGKICPPVEALGDFFHEPHNVAVRDDR